MQGLRELRALLAPGTELGLALGVLALEALPGLFRVAQLRLEPRDLGVGGIERSLCGVQGIAGACIVGATAGLASVAWQPMRWVDRIGELAIQFELRRAGIAAASTFAATHGLPLLLAVAAGVVLAPLALYLTLADD